MLGNFMLLIQPIINQKKQNMKKFLLSTFVFAVMAFAASAQTQKGTMLLGGGAGFSSSDGTTTWNISPSLGTFVKDNFAMGAFLGISDNGGGSVTNLGAYLKPYFGKQENGKMFAKAMLGSMDSEFTWGGSLGYAAFLNKSVALEFGANYDKMGDMPGVFGLGVGFQIHFKK
jgi:hypothetical protein